MRHRTLLEPIEMLMGVLGPRGIRGVNIRSSASGPGNWPNRRGSQIPGSGSRGIVRQGGQSSEQVVVNALKPAPGKGLSDLTFHATALTPGEDLAFVPSRVLSASGRIFLGQPAQTCAARGNRRKLRSNDWGMVHGLERPGPATFGHSSPADGRLLVRDKLPFVVTSGRFPTRNRDVRKSGRPKAQRSIDRSFWLTLITGFRPDTGQRQKRRPRV